MKKVELVFIPAPPIGHLVSAVKLARLLVDHDERLSITFLIITVRVNPKIDNYIDSVRAATDRSRMRIRFIYLPRYDPTPEQRLFLSSLIETQKPQVIEEVAKFVSQSDLVPDSPRLAGFVLDMFCTSMIDVANEFGVPSYIFFTSSAAFLGLELYIVDLHDEQKVDPTVFKDSDTELVLPCLAKPLPTKALPPDVTNKDWLPHLIGPARRYREAKGIMVNTFEELESQTINSFYNGNNPPVYPVGPILNLEGDGHHVGPNAFDDIKKWLDDQPPSSVVFLCFGSMGSFGEEQVKEIACGLERSGHRFLWSLRQPPPKGEIRAPTDCANPEEVLPEGFLDRTAKIGKVIGWAPQKDILAHPSVGGFVSHCGWNSILESIWFGVPIAAWPIYAEQQYSAFLMIVEFGLAVEIKMDYVKDFTAPGSEEVVSAERIEKGVKCLMEIDGEKREKLKETSEKCKKALMKGGSSNDGLGRLIQNLVDNMPN